MKCCAAIIVAAGSSRRAGFDKLLAPLHGVRVLERSIRAFANCREITEIVRPYRIRKTEVCVQVSAPEHGENQRMHG